MMKKITTINIDAEVLEKAKKELPNLSGFVEDCLKAYFGWNDTRIRTIDENLTVIQNALLNIQIASREDAKIQVSEDFSVAQQNRAWISVWASDNVDNNVWEQSANILNCTVKELQELVRLVDYEIDATERFKCNRWGYVKKHYLRR